MDLPMNATLTSVYDNYNAILLACGSQDICDIAKHASQLINNDDEDQCIAALEVLRNTLVVRANRRKIPASLQSILLTQVKGRSVGNGVSHAKHFIRAYLNDESLIDHHIHKEFKEPIPRDLCIAGWVGTPYAINWLGSVMAFSKNRKTRLYCAKCLACAGSLRLVNESVWSDIAQESEKDSPDTWHWIENAILLSYRASESAVKRISDILTSSQAEGASNGALRVATNWLVPEVDVTDPAWGEQLSRYLANSAT